jgi:hypothetical protein
MRFSSETAASISIARRLSVAPHSLIIGTAQMVAAVVPRQA